MPLLPIVERELRVAARRPFTYRARFWSVCAVIGVMGWKVLTFSWEGMPMAAQGRFLFVTTSLLAFVYCFLIGARLTADCLSSEKREGTLGILFLTDLKAWDIVFGKMAANSLNSVYAVLGVLPLLALPLLLGGVTVTQYVQMGLVLLNTLFFSLCMGILVSSMCRVDRKAMFGTLLAVLLPIGIPLGLLVFRVFIKENVSSPLGIMELLPWLVADPIYGFSYVIWPGLPFPPLPPWSYWVSLAVVHGLSWIGLIAAVGLLPHVWKDRGAREGRMAWLRALWERCSLGDTKQRKDFRRRWLDVDPYTWLVARDRLKPIYAWFFLGAVIVIWWVAYWNHRDLMFDFYPLVPTVVLIHSFFKAWILAEACYRLAEDQKSGALELLLVTPLTLRSMVGGQFRALRRQFAWPFVALAVLEYSVFLSAYGWFLIGAGLIMLLVDGVALVWVGMYLSLSARGINRAMVSSFSLVLGTPWIIHLVGVSIWGWMRSMRERLTLEEKTALWLVVGLVVDVILIYWARKKMLGRPGG